MYCPHCAKKIDETKIEASSNFDFIADQEVAEDASIAYVCPRCGHLIHENLAEEEVKSLSRAAHAQIQRARNFFASGMGLVSVGVILLAIGILFFVLAHKPSNGYELTVGSAEFIVAAALGIVAVILLVVGGVFVVRGILTKRQNSLLLKEINNGTFVQ